jgi:hypothetical protein
MGAVEDLLGSREFQLGFVCGTAALLGVLVLVGCLPSIKPRRRGLVGPALILAALVASAGWFGLHQSLSIQWVLPVGAILVFAGMEAGVRLPRLERSWWLRPFMLVPGAAIAAFGVEWGRPWWLPWMVFVGTCICGPLTADFDARTARLGLGPVMFAVALGGAYLYLPENDAIRSLLGVAIPLALAGVPLRMARVGNGGSALVTLAFLWFVARESNNVPIQSWVMIFALGLMITEPVGYYFGRSLVGWWTVERIPWNPVKRAVRSLMNGAAGSPTIALQWITIAAQVGIVVYVARVVGFTERYPGYNDLAKYLTDQQRQTLGVTWAGGAGGLPALLLLPALALGFVYGWLVGLSPRLHHRKIRRSGGHRAVVHASSPPGRRGVVRPRQASGAR